MFLQNIESLPIINVNTESEIVAFQNAARRGWKFYKSYKFLTILLAFLVFSIISFFATSTFLMEQNYVINELQDDIYNAKQGLKTTQVSLSQESSLQNVLEESSIALYSELEYINYIERSSNSPFSFGN